MKKVSILFLLTVLLVSFTFAIDGVGDFTAKVAVEATGVQDSDVLDVVIKPSIGFSTAIDALTIDATVILPVDLALPDIPGLDGPYIGLQLDTLKIGYSLAAGPGTLKFWVENWNEIWFNNDFDDELKGHVNPAFNYAIPAGPGILTPEAGIEFLYAPDSDLNTGYFSLTYAADLGLTVTAKGTYGFLAEDYVETLVDIGYTLSPEISFGAETIIANDLDVNGVKTTPRATVIFGDFTFAIEIPIEKIASDFDVVVGVTPKVTYNIGTAIAVGLELPIGNLTDEATVGVTLWGSYKF